MSSEHARTTHNGNPLAPQSTVAHGGVVNEHATKLDSRETFRGEDSERSHPK